MISLHLSHRHLPSLQLQLELDIGGADLDFSQMEPTVHSDDDELAALAQAAAELAPEAAAPLTEVSDLRRSLRHSLRQSPAPSEESEESVEMEMDDDDEI